MKIINLESQQTYDFEPRKSGEGSYPCPSCSKVGRHNNKNSFSWNGVKQAGFCHSCNCRFVPFKQVVEKIDYKLPEWKNKTDLSDNAVKYFEGRMIKQTTLTKMKIYSDKEWMPKIEKETTVICFPYFFNENLINIKFRDGSKGFKLVSGAELIFYNIDCIKDFNDIIITEGEIDALSFMECGLNNVISVPNGANIKCEYLDNYIDLFEGKSIVIAVDNDIAGLKLRNELIRRFGSENCSIINFKDCKDSNEYLCTHGGLELKQAYDNRQNIPVEGVVDIEKCYDDIYSLYINGLQPGLKINDTLDDCITWESQRVATWTGIPSHGKSEVLDDVLIKLNHIHKWKSAYFSPENYPIKYHYAKLASKISGVPFSSYQMDNSEFIKLFDYIQNNFYFIYPDTDFTLNSILDKARYLVKSKGIKVLTLDPYNKFEHLREKGQSETDYISMFMDKLSIFAKRNDILINLVAHPTKMKKDKDGIKFEIPTLYDISGSAHFYNKTDYGITVYREWGETPHVQIHVQKVKFLHLGEGGMVRKLYNKSNGRLENYETPYNEFSRNSLLDDVVREEIKDIVLTPNTNFHEPKENYEKSISGKSTDDNSIF